MQILRKLMKRWTKMSERTQIGWIKVALGVVVLTTLMLMSMAAKGAHEVEMRVSYKQEVRMVFLYENFEEKIDNIMDCRKNRLSMLSILRSLTYDKDFYNWTVTCSGVIKL